MANPQSLRIPIYKQDIYLQLDINLQYVSTANAALQLYGGKCQETVSLPSALLATNRQKTAGHEFDHALLYRDEVIRFAEAAR